MSSSSQRCGGLASCVYLKAGRVRVQQLPFRSQIFKMQRVYMHSTEHFEVFTTVLAPQGEWRRVLIYTISVSEMELR